MNHVVKAKMLRESDEPIHYNCAQSLLSLFPMSSASVTSGPLPWAQTMAAV